MLRQSNAKYALRSVGRAGFVASLELLASLFVISLSVIVSLAAIRDSITSEISDLSGSVQDVMQNYSLDGTTGNSSTTSGMVFGDADDHCDDADDISGSADNCITFGVAPTNEILGFSLDGLAFFFDFQNGVPAGTTLVGDANVSSGTLNLDGNGDLLDIDNSSDINLGIHDMRTISLDFFTNDVITRQVLYEEGGGVRGLNIYIDNGFLYVGGWNIPAGESGWAPIFIATPITPGVWNNATLVLNGTPTVQPGALTGYLNGSAFGSAAGSQIWNHPGGVGLGAINNVTIFHDGAAGSGANFTGMIDDFYLFNRVLDPSEVQAIANQ